MADTATSLNGGHKQIWLIEIADELVYQPSFRGKGTRHLDNVAIVDYGRPTSLSCLRARGGRS
jgi:hypothetical protein